MASTEDGLGGVLITADDWKKIHALEERARAKVDEAKINLWAIKKLIGDDVTRLAKVGNGIKIAVIVGAIVGTVNTLVVMSTPATRAWRSSCNRSGGRRWRDTDGDQG